MRAVLLEERKTTSITSPASKLRLEILDVLVYIREVVVALNLFTVSGAYNGSETWNLKVVKVLNASLVLLKKCEDPPNQCVLY